MAYFIVETPYEKCFELFFKTELGYPNFYRMSELLPHAQYQHLTLVAPYPIAEAPQVLEKIMERVNTLELKYLSFGEGLETAFVFGPEGKLNLSPQFTQALDQAALQFIQRNNQMPAKSA